MRKYVWALLAFAAVPLPAQGEERWELTDARVEVRFNQGLLNDLGVRLSPAVRADGDGYAPYALGAQGRLIADAPGSIFRTVTAGELRLSGGPAFQAARSALSLEGAVLRPGAEPSTYTIAGADGSPLFVADHQHVTIDRDARTARLYNLDLRLSPELAARVGHPRHANLAVGVVEINAAAAIPFGSEERPDGACTTPNWGAPDNDVGLIGISPIQQVATGGGVVAIAPSAVLKNIGTTDVPWQVKFSPPAPPYNTDQHPFLVWNMYRVTEGALEQIGASGLKHAFTTVNSNCGCPGGSVLWVGNGGCEDTYGVGTNNSTGSLGPRTEITAHTGVWTRCGSIFDPDCNNVQNTPPGFSGPADDRRLTVLQTDLTNISRGTQFYFDAWYVVRDDVNIFNTMGYRQVTPSLSGTTWSFSTVTPLTAGAVVDTWVNPVTPGPNADNKRIETGEGRLTLAVRARNVGGSLWRYDYALMNHDFDRRIRSLTLPLPAGATVVGTSFHDVDRNAATDWAASTNPTELSWTAPAGVPKAPQDWGLLYSFSVQVDRAPSAVGAVTIRLGIEEAPGGELTVASLGPAAP